MAGRNKNFQRLVFVLAQLHSGQWSSPPFYSTQVRLSSGPPEFFTFSYCACLWNWPILWLTHDLRESHLPHVWGVSPLRDVIRFHAPPFVRPNPRAHGDVLFGTHAEPLPWNTRLAQFDNIRKWLDSIRESQACSTCTLCPQRRGKPGREPPLMRMTKTLVLRGPAPWWVENKKRSRDLYLYSCLLFTWV